MGWHSLKTSASTQWTESTKSMDEFVYTDHTHGSNITFYYGQDLFDSQAHVIVNAVNCVGVMGKGIALKFKERFPAMFSEYKRYCGLQQVRCGEPYLHKHMPNRWVLMFPTKQHWQNKSQIGWIEAGLEYFVEHAKLMGVRSVAFPALGCGLGGLNWNDVCPVMIEHLKKLDMPVEIYAPNMVTQ